MRKKTVRIVGSILIFSLSFSLMTTEIFAAAEQKNRSKTDGWGYLKLTSKHNGLAVKIDEAFIGFSPLEILALEPGPHQVQVEHPEQANWLDHDWHREINVVEGDTIWIEVSFNRNYSIHSSPFGASVFLGDEKIGETPTFLKLDETEIKQITLSKAGYQDTILTLGSSNNQFFDIKLRRKSEEPGLTLIPGEFRIKKKSKTNRRLFAAIGLTIASGAIGIYFRNKANNQFDRYLQFGDPERFNESFDQAKKFDNYAAVSFAAFQVSFALSVYLFLKKVNN